MGALGRLAERLAGGQSTQRRRDSTVFFDTAVTALTGVLIVVAAARHLSPLELAAFSLAQLATTTTVGLLRASIYNPAMATQRSTGRSRIPASWSLTVAVPAALVLAVVIGPLVGRTGGSVLSWMVCLAVCGSVILVQDSLRSALVSANLSHGALWSDLLALLLLVVGWAFNLIPVTSQGVMYYWAAAYLLALAFSVLYTRLKGEQIRAVPAQSLRLSWRIGRWAALDSGFAAIASLLPMFVATLYIGNASAGVYRTLQSAMGPLNILHTTIVTVFGLDAWRTASRDGLHQLRRKTNRLAAGMALLSAGYVVVALPVMVAITELEDPDLVRIAVILGATAVLGACNTPFNAAALSLGYQRFGAIIRLLAVACSVVISLPILDSAWVPWRDPIGTAMLFSAVITLGGWALSYRVAVRREETLLEQSAEPAADDQAEPAP